MISPRIIDILNNLRAVEIYQSYYISLRIFYVVINRAVVVHRCRADRVIGEVQLIAAPRQLHQLVAQIMVIVRRAVDGLRDALAVGIVAVGDCLAGLAHPRELAAMLPCIRPRAVAQEVADLVRRQALPADAREQIAPTCITVAVVDGALRRAEISSRIGVLCLALDVAAVIVGIGPRLPRRLIVLADYSLTFKSSRFVGLDSF